MDSLIRSTEKQAKELRERRYSALLDNSREKKIKDIRASFEACKKRPVHETNKKLRPVEILPLFPDFDRLEDQFVVATFDGPTLDSESYNKMEKSVRDAHESQAIMKSFVSSSSDTAKPDKFLAYMVPSVGELSKDIYDESEDISYTWVREYHWDVRGEDVNDPTNFLVSFGESEARYMSLPTKLMLRKKRARDRKASGEVEHFPVPAHITVRQRSRVPVDMKEPELQHENTRPEEGGITLKQAFAVFELAYDQLEKDYEKEKLRADNERMCKEKESAVRVSLENEISFLNSKILSLTQKVSSVQEHPSAELKLLQGRVSEKENELKRLQEEKERVNNACACSKSGNKCKQPLKDGSPKVK